MESNGNNLTSRERNLLSRESGKDKEEISAYSNSLDLADKLLIRDTYFLFCGGNKSEHERNITKILSGRGFK